MKLIIEEIDKQRNEIIDFTKKLIDIPTVNPPGLNYERFIDFLEGKCKQIKLETIRHIVPEYELKRLEINGGSSRVNLISSWNASAKKTLHINSHYDVVPATGNWQTAPFKAVVNAGKLFGRGAEDMKANIACVIFAIETLKKLRIMPKVNIELSFTPDEETGGQAGLRYLIDKNLVKADYVIGEGYEHDFVSIGNKGILWLEIEVLGKSAHSSVPYQGENSFENMVLVVNELSKLKEKLKERKTKYTTKNKKQAYSTMVIGGLFRGGGKINIVPDSSIFSVDRRLIFEENSGQALKEIERIIGDVRKKNKKVKVKIKVVAKEDAVVTKMDKHFFETFSEAAKFVLKKKLKTAVMSGATDLRFFMRRGIPALGYSVKGEDLAHADNEFVYVDSIINTTKIFALLMSNLT